MLFFDPLPPTTPTPMPISSLTSYFQPITLHQVFDPVVFHSAFTDAFFGSVGQIMATLWSIATPQILGTYVAIRVGILAYMFMAGFVMKRIGVPMRESSVTVMGVKTSFPKLPSGLGPSVLRRGKR